MNKGTDPKSEVVQKLAARWEGLIREFTGGNPEVRKSLDNMYQHENPEQASHGFVDREVIRYIEKAMTNRDPG